MSHNRDDAIEKRMLSSGLTHKSIAMLPAIVTLFGLSGLPAFGAAAFAMLANQEFSARKMREFERAMHVGIGEIEARLENIESSVGASDALANTLQDRVHRLSGCLSPSQLEQLGVLFEQYMRTLGDERLKLLRNAVRAVAAMTHDEDVNQAVVAALGPLHANHIRELQRFSLALKDRRYRPSSHEMAAKQRRLQAPLIAGGLLRVNVDVSLQKRGMGVQGSGIVDGTAVSRFERLTITVIGRAALEILRPGPLEPTHDH